MAVLYNTLRRRLYSEQTITLVFSPRLSRDRQPDDHTDVSNCNQESPRPSEAWNKLDGSAVGSYLHTKPSHLDHAAYEIWVLSYVLCVIQEVKTCQDWSETDQK